MTRFEEVIECFYSSFIDKTEIPDDLVIVWLKRAISQYGIEIEELGYDDVLGVFHDDLSPYIIDTLALCMKVLYLERELSRVNKIASIVTKDISVNSNMNLSKVAYQELSETKQELNRHYYSLKETAYC